MEQKLKEIIEQNKDLSISIQLNSGKIVTYSSQNDEIKIENGLILLKQNDYNSIIDIDKIEKISY
jgi:hypothetical protein